MSNLYNNYIKKVKLNILMYKVLGCKWVYKSVNIPAHV